MNNLPEIRDIQIPDGVSFFPVAYGWWVVLAAGVFAFMITPGLCRGYDF